MRQLCVRPGVRCTGPFLVLSSRHALRPSVPRAGELHREAISHVLPSGHAACRIRPNYCDPASSSVACRPLQPTLIPSASAAGVASGEIRRDGAETSGGETPP